tara:strand:- start:169 stop:549 length:381 start_codon:yes stop_codon:yes gene_type:complete
MIQRIQTLYIILGAILHFFPWQWDNEFPYSLFIILLGTLLVLVTIFSYNSRQRQVTILYLMIAMVLIPIFESSLIIVSTTPWVPMPTKLLGILMLISQILAVIFYILAIKSIKKDDDLIKSIDRIR